MPGATTESERTAMAAAPAKAADPEHWSYIKPVRPAPPTTANVSWPRNDIDRFVLARLEQEKLAPSPEAPKATLLRRVTLDLTGLPPTVAELDAFIADTRPDAYERVVDRLLASPALRRALGAPVARPCALRRHQRPRKGQSPQHLEVSRLGDRRAQPRHAVRSVHDRTDRRRHAAERDASSRRSPPASTAMR